MGEQERTDRAAWEGEMFRLLVENVLDYAIFVVDPHRHIRSWNKGAERLLGFTEWEIIGRQCDGFFTPEDVRDGVPQKELDEALQSGRGADDRWHVRKDGTRFWASGVVTPLKDESGTLRGYCKIMRDCTDLKRSQDELADSQRRHKALFDHTLDAVLLADDEGRYVDANPAACTLLGITRNDLLQRTVLDITPLQNADAGRTAWQSFLSEGRQVGEYALLRPDGTWVIVEYRAVANFQPGLHLSVFRDVTEREALLRQVRTERERLADVFRQSPVFMCVVRGPDHVFEQVNDRYLQLVGHRDLLGKPVREALPEVEGQGLLELLDGVYRTGEPFVGSGVRVLLARRAGQPPEERYVDFVYQPLREPGGVTAGIVAMGVDVTDRRNAEEQLRASEERYRTVVADLTEVVCRVLADGTFLFVNDACCRLVGKPADELLGRPGTTILHSDDVARVQAELATLSPENPVVRIEHRVLDADGRTRWMEFVNQGMFGPDGELAEFQAVGRDVTARREADKAIRESEARLERAQAVAKVGSWETDLSTMEVAWSTESHRIFEVPPNQKQLTHQDFLKIVHPEDRAAVDAAFFRSLDHCLPCEIEHRILLPDGAIKVIEERWQSQQDGRGKPVRVVGTCQDVTQRKQAEDAIRFSEERYRSLADAMPQMVWVTGPDGYHDFYNRQWYEYTGLTFEQSKGEGWNSAFHPDDRPQASEGWRYALATGEPFEGEYRRRRHDGEYRWFLVRALPQRDTAGEIVRWFGTATDIHDFKQAQSERDAALARLELQIDRMPLAFMLSDADFKCTRWNPAAERTFGFSEAEVLGKHPLEILVPPAARPRVAEVLDRLRAGDMDANGVNENVTKDGRVIVCEWHNTPLLGPSGAFEGHIALAQDVTERNLAEGAKARLAAIVESSDDAIISIDIGGKITSWNAGAERLYGYTAAEVVGRHYSVLLPPAKEAEADAALSRVRRGEAVPAFETHRRHKAGRVIDVTVSVSPIRDAGGPVVGASKIARDITRTKILEEQFRQAQKMEAVGQLAGGVAHDFNNLLTVINGYVELVQEELPIGHPSRELVAEIKSAGERAADLTGQLLAFSRQTVLEPRILDPNALVREVQGMLGRLLGEDIELACRLAPSVGRVKADPGQLEQAVVNLCVNARDAMPTGGQLMVETDDADLDAAYTAAHPEVRPGPYVLIAVSDTGTGMTPEVQSRIFEPFYTTKAVGKGTGLGLAMVFGFVKQSGGHIAVYSELGRGTTFKLYLPRVAEAQLAEKSVIQRIPMPKGTETVLLVEDESAVRALGRHILARCGYTVLEAANGRDAVKAAEGHAGPVHILVTDVVMPGGMGGRQVAEAVRQIHPETKVLFTSGYTDDSVVRHGVLEAETHFLQKPFTPSALARKVRVLLDGEG